MSAQIKWGGRLASRHCQHPSYYHHHRCRRYRTAGCIACRMMLACHDVVRSSRSVSPSHSLPLPSAVRPTKRDEPSRALLAMRWHVRRLMDELQLASITRIGRRLGRIACWPNVMERRLPTRQRPCNGTPALQTNHPHWHQRRAATRNTKEAARLTRV